MGRVTGIQWYYHAQCLLFLFLTIYSFVFVSTYSSDKCYALNDTSTSTNSTSTNSTTTNSTASNTTTNSTCPVSANKATTSLTVIAGILGFVYIAEVILMLGKINKMSSISYCTSSFNCIYSNSRTAFYGFCCKRLLSCMSFRSSNWNNIIWGYAISSTSINSSMCFMLIKHAYMWRTPKEKCILRCIFLSA